MANLNIINVSSIHSHIWQHLVPVGQLYKHMANGTKHITPFSPEESTGDTDAIWTLISHTETYVMAIQLLIPAGLGIFCCYFFWC